MAEQANQPPCPECGQPIEATWDWCHRCGYDPEGLRPESWRRPVPRSPEPTPPGTPLPGTPSMRRILAHGASTGERSPAAVGATFTGSSPAKQPRSARPPVVAVVATVAVLLVVAAGISVGFGIGPLANLVAKAGIPGATELPEAPTPDPTGAVPSGWVPVATPGSGFRAALPGPPAQQVVSAADTPEQFSVDASIAVTDQQQLYLAGVGEFSVPSRDRRRRLADLVSGIVSGTGGTVTTYRFTTFLGRTSLSYELVGPEVHGYGLAIADSGRVYLLQVAGALAAPADLDRLRDTLAFTAA